MHMKYVFNFSAQNVWVARKFHGPWIYSSKVTLKSCHIDTDTIFVLKLKFCLVNFPRIIFLAEFWHSSCQICSKRERVDGYCFLSESLLEGRVKAVCAGGFFFILIQLQGHVPGLSVSLWRSTQSLPFSSSVLCHFRKVCPVKDTNL